MKTILKYFSYVLFSSSKPPITLRSNFLSAQYLFFCPFFVHYHFIWNGFLNPVFIPYCSFSSALSLLCHLQNGLYKWYKWYSFFFSSIPKLQLLLFISFGCHHIFPTPPNFYSTLILVKYLCLFYKSQQYI